MSKDTAKPTCALCDNFLTTSNASSEHIIPNAIGGRKTVNGFICRHCNSTYGSHWDADLSLQINWFCLMFRIKRQRGDIPSMPVTTLDGRELILRADGSFIHSKPVYEENVEGNIVQIKIQARSVKEANKMQAGVKRKYPQINHEESLLNMEDRRQPLDSLVKMSLTLGGSEYGRSLVKTALAFASANGVALPKSSVSFKYLLENVSESHAPYGFFYSRDLVTGRNKARVCHCVALEGDPVRKTLIAYVEYFSFARYIVLLSDTYDGKEIRAQYAIDPVTTEEIPIQISLDLSERELSLILADIFDEEAYMREAVDVMALALEYNSKRGREQAVLDAMNYAQNQLGLTDDTPMNKEVQQQFEEYFRIYWDEYQQAQAVQKKRMEELIEEERKARKIK